MKNQNKREHIIDQRQKELASMHLADKKKLFSTLNSFKPQWAAFFSLYQDMILFQAWN